MTWILDDFFNSIDLEYDDAYLNVLSSRIQVWKDLFKKTMTADEEDEVNLIIVVEKIIEMRDHMFSAFPDIILSLKMNGLVSDKSIKTWKALEDDKCGYEAKLEGFIALDLSSHKKLVASVKFN